MDFSSPCSNCLPFSGGRTVFQAGPSVRALLPLFAALWVLLSCVRVESLNSSPAQPGAGRSDRERILDAVLRDLLNNPGLKDARDFFGTPGDREIALVSNTEHGLCWPAHYCPSVPGWKARPVIEGRRPQEERRLLGVRLDKFDLGGQDESPFDAPVKVTILNAGGYGNGAVIGGCCVSYAPKRQGAGWTVVCRGVFDP